MQNVFYLQRAADEDFTFETHNLSLTGTKIFTVSVAIHDDNEVERQESFLGVLSAIGTLSSRVTLFPAVSAVYIIDDDGKYCFQAQCREGTSCGCMSSYSISVIKHLYHYTAVIGFKEIGYSVNEGEGIVRFRVQVRSGTPSKDVAVLFHTEDRTAKGQLIVQLRLYTYNEFYPTNEQHQMTMSLSTKSIQED